MAGKSRRLFFRMVQVVVLMIACLPGHFDSWAGEGMSPQGFWLISLEEAAMAPLEVSDLPSDVTDIGRGAIDFGPIIEIIKPSGAKVAIAPPVEILVHFVKREFPIDPESIEVELVKFFTIDITDRVKPYISKDGIHIPEANLPEGEHQIRLTVADTEGTSSSKDMIVRIE